MIAAALSWFDEPGETLERCVRSLAGVADVIVALDGRWLLYPGPEVVSPLEQGEALHAAAAEAGIPVVDATCPAGRPWDSQMAKRSTLMRLAAELAPWTLVIDADESVDADPAALTDALRDTSLDVAEVTLVKAGAGVFDTRPRPRRRLYRASAGVRVELGHNGYRAADGRWLNGDPEHVELEPAADVTAHLRITHDLDAHPPARREKADVYYRLRRRMEAEWALV